MVLYPDFALNPYIPYIVRLHQRLKCECAGGQTLSAGLCRVPGAHHQNNPGLLAIGLGDGRQTDRFDLQFMTINSFIWVVVSVMLVNPHQA